MKTKRQRKENERETHGERKREIGSYCSQRGGKKKRERNIYKDRLYRQKE